MKRCGCEFKLFGYLHGSVLAVKLAGIGEVLDGEFSLPEGFPSDATGYPAFGRFGLFENR